MQISFENTSATATPGRDYGPSLDAAVREALRHPAYWLVAAVLMLLRRPALKAALEIEGQNSAARDRFLYPLH